MASQSPMYRAFVEVVPEASNFTGALTGQVTAASAAAGAAGGKAAAGGLLAGMGKAVPLLGAGLAALGIGDLIGDALNDGANYEQAFGAVEDVFEDASAAIVKFSKTSAKQLGLSATQALVGAKDFGIFGRAAGLTGDDLADFSTELLSLGSDLAAFGNTSPEEAVIALGAGLRGESEPLRRFGVLLDDAKLRARALELGIYDGNGALTSQQKILAAQAEIFAQTGIQQGQFARESDTLAAKQAILAASWEDISTKLGTAFLPVAQEVVDMLTDDLIPALEDFTEWLNKPDTQKGIKQFAEGVREAGNFLRDYFFVPLSDTFGLVAGFAGLLNGLSFDDFKKKMVELPGFYGAIFRAAEDATIGVWNSANGMILAVRGFAGDVQRNLMVAVSWFQNLPGEVGRAFSNAGSWLFNAGRDVIAGFINGITSMVNSVKSAITKTVGGTVDFAKNLLGIHSPSTVFADIGRNTGLGFAEGIESQYQNVQVATGGLTQAAVAGTESTGRPVQVDVHAAPGMDAETVGQIAANRVTFELRSA